MSRHGGNLRKLRQQAGGEVIDFSASINPYGSPEWLRGEVLRNIEECAHYPDPDCTELVNAAAREFSIAGDSIVACNGISEALAFLPYAVKCNRAFIPAPGYGDYAPYCRNAGMDVEFYKLLPDNNFAYPEVSTLARMITPEDMIFICTPNNPAGAAVGIEYIAELAALCPESVIVVDMAYFDFMHDSMGNPLGDRDCLRDLPDNVIVLWSLTKFYSIAGLRLGLVFAHENISGKLRSLLPSWSVNTLAQAVGARALGDRGFYDDSRKLAAELYTGLFAELSSISGLIAFPSKCNFILCCIENEKMSAAELARLLLCRGIAIRDGENIEGLDKYYFRVAVRCKEDNDKLLRGLKEELDAGECSAVNKPTKNKTPALMLLGCSSSAGKSIITAAMCRIMKQDGIKVAPFKAQNMALNSAVTVDGGEIGRAQELQAQAAGIPPQVRLNPLLLKPTGNTGSQVVLNGKVLGNFKVREYYAKKEELFAEVKAAYDSLAADYDAIVLEGAGSPGEVNLKSNDIVNLRMAEYAQALSLLVGDIDRGGVYASFIGHYETFTRTERELVKGFIVNRFRGDASLLQDAHDYVRDFTGREVWGVVPYLSDLQLPQEDSVSLEHNFAPQKNKHADALDVALIVFPHMANYTDFDAIKNEPDVRLRLVRSGGDLGKPDLLLLPGSKNVPGDIAYMCDSGQFAAVLEYAGNGGYIAGICGGLQMLGLGLSDPYGIEGDAGGEYKCLGLLPVHTVMEKNKILKRVCAKHLPSGLDVFGFEMHHGVTGFAGMIPLVQGADGTVLGIGDDRIWATYLHGVFDADEFRRYFIDRIRAVKGMQPIGNVLYRHDCEESLNKLAAVVREALPVERIYRQMGL